MQTPIRLQVGAKEVFSEEERGRNEPGFRAVFELRSSNAVMPTDCIHPRPTATDWPGIHWDSSHS